MRLARTDLEENKFTPILFQILKMTELTKVWSKEMDSLQNQANNITGYQRAVEIATGIETLRTQINEFETIMKPPELSASVVRRDAGAKNNNYSRPEWHRPSNRPRKTSFVSIEVKIAF